MTSASGRARHAHTRRDLKVGFGVHKEVGARLDSEAALETDGDSAGVSESNPSR